jgi:GNAT superfamily N-acetyltransferase
MTSIKISALTEADIPDFLEQCISERGDTEWPRLADLAQQMLRQERAIWLAHKDGILSGMITLRWQSDYAGFRKNPPAPEIVDLYIWQQKRRHGIARALLAHAEQDAVTRGFHRIGLGVGILPDDMPAWRLYLAQGYAFDGSGGWWKGNAVTEYQNIQPHDVPILLMMHKYLNTQQAQTHV